MSLGRAIGARLALVLGVCLGSAALADDALDTLLLRLESVRQEEQVPALGLALVSAEEVLHVGAYGVRDLASGTPADGETMFRIGSITKTFTSLAALLLAERGLLDLEDPVTQHLDEVPFDNPWATQAPVRIAHLLEHTAGFQDLLGEEWAVREALALDDALAFQPSSRTVRWPPGTHSSYSNSGAGVAAKVFEVVSGQPFEALLQEQLFDPLGMASASLRATPRTRARLAVGYDRDGRTRWPTGTCCTPPSGPST